MTSEKTRRWKKWHTRRSDVLGHKGEGGEDAIAYSEKSREEDTDSHFTDAARNRTMRTGRIKFQTDVESQISRYPKEFRRRFGDSRRVPKTLKCALNGGADFT